MKNSQVAVICAAILAAALINAAGNYRPGPIAPAASVGGPSRDRPPARAASPPAAEARPHADHGGDDAQEQGERLFHRLPQGGRGGGDASWASS